MKDDSKNRKITHNEFNTMSSEEKILKMTNELIPPSGKPENEVLDSLLDKIEQSAPTKIFKFKKLIQAVAAIIILLLSIYSVNSYLSNEIIKTQFAKQTEITLPEGTKVTLNADSKLKWSNNQFEKDRQLTLKGEAYFDVIKGDEFIIKTKLGTVEILGTQLNVFSRDNIFWVSCISGKVKVSANNKHQIILPGEIVELTQQGLIKTIDNNIKKTTSWKEGIFYFEDKPLISIFAELERQFDVSIQYKKLEDRLITVSFSNKKLSEALDIICIPMGLNYEVDNNQKVRIYKKQK
ncbi:MAG: DUF4974 domain-containing protein [Draconibacterium sp.]|nr:DUF4974 domain-containing protein [Draconibacterium sp.]